MSPTPSPSLLAPVAATVLASLAAAQIHERPVPPPLRAPFTQPATPPGVASQNNVRRGPFVSVQVNVDRQGRNIRGDAANEPSIAIDPTDPKRIVIGWRQFDTVNSSFRKNGWAYSHDGGKTWTFPGSIENSFNSDPVLDTDVGGRFYYLSYPGGRTLKLFRSTNGGVSWTGPTRSTGGDKAWMLVDRSASSGRGFVYVIWQVLHGPNTFVRSVDGGASFQGPFAVPQWPTFGTLDTDPRTGRLFATGLYRQSFGTFVVARSDTARDRTKTPTFTTTRINLGGSMAFRGTPNPGGLLGQAQIAADPARPGHVYVLCSVNPPGSDPMDVHLVRSTDGGATFGRPIRVNDDPTTNGAWQWFGTLSVAPNGRIDVVWNDTRAGPATSSETYYAYSLDGGATWSKNVPVGPAWQSRIGWPRQSKIGDYYHMRSDAAEAHLAYAATYNGEQDVYYLRLGDCNGNRVHDGLDLARGTGFDANRNAILDECETCQNDLGGGAGLRLRVCGDDLTRAGAKATFQLEGGPARSTVVVVLSLSRLNPPFPLPGGGLLIPDIGAPGAVVFDGYATNANGRLGAVWSGGPRNTTRIFAQAAMLAPGRLLVSNAVEVRIGLP